MNRVWSTILAGALMLPATASIHAQESKPPTDSMLRTMVEYKLIQEKLQRGDAITVTVKDGVATLKGRADSAWQVKRAEKAALDVPGVNSVRNELKVDMSGDMPDAKIAAAVASAIRSSVWFDIFDWVEGSVQNGVVTLKGAVREPWRRNEYGQLAEGLRGVVKVDNQIRALPLSNFDDSLRIRVAHLIYGNQAFVRYANRSLPPIHILVENGQVTLKGAVNNAMEKQQAFMLANQTDAFSVTNDLQVDSR